MSPDPTTLGWMRRELTIASLAFVVVVAGAFLGALNLSLVSPETLPAGVQEGQTLDFQITFFTAWAALILVAPALCAFPFRRASDLAARYWLAFWTVSWVAYLIHFYWAVVVFFGGDWSKILNSPDLVSVPVLDTVVTVWWGLDIVLAWLVRSKVGWIRVQRVLIHLLVLLLFVLGSAVEGSFLVPRLFGVALALSVLVSSALWLRSWMATRRRAPAGVV
jgi:hypothetical protein